jgi:hypothetical protein
MLAESCEHARRGLQALCQRERRREIRGAAPRGLDLSRRSEPFQRAPLDERGKESDGAAAIGDLERSPALDVPENGTGVLS